jgi:PAS domain S-box-containing protein
MNDTESQPQPLKLDEDRFRDLFEEAPIAYVLEGIDSRIFRVNRAAERILGATSDQVVGAFGRSLVPDTRDAQERVNNALGSIRGGSEASGLVLELRRKDNNQPVWIQWHSRPSPDLSYTRTMFFDITDLPTPDDRASEVESTNTAPEENGFGDIIGQSDGVRRVLGQVQLVAPSLASVLITGESGTGKELIARAIHGRSTRSGAQMVNVNCAAIPESLFESEFFGHVKGAFTGAAKDRPGRFELADGGTLFLDEIGALPLDMQAKLLRVLQEREVERVGDTRTRSVNVRIIAATNLDLRKEVDAGRFRQDLFYRLSVFPIEIPPLRDRREDIAPLIDHFIEQSANRMGLPVPRVSQSELNRLMEYSWPGNVRELENAAERAVILSQGGALRFDFPELMQGEPASSTAVPSNLPVLTREQLKRQERENIAAALKQTGGKVFGANGAAELLGMKPTTLASRIAALGLNRRPES